MANQPKKLLVLSSGGDAPGMNAAIRAAVRSARYYDIDVYGAENGYTGLMQEQIMPLSEADVANCIMRGGTILKTGRCPAFKEKAVRDQCRAFLKQQQFDAMIVLGGDGSFAGAELLAEEGGPAVIGIPCTIDNDINGTEYCIGFDTACNTALEAIDKIRDTAFSFDRNFLIEVMGRSSGFLAVEVGIAGGAEVILIPEYPLTPDELVEKIQNKHRKKLASIIVVAESDQPGCSIKLAEDIKNRSGIEYRVCILGHTQRGGTPTVHDRKVASLMGANAVEALRAGHTKLMTAIQKGKYCLTPFPQPGKGTRYFNDEQVLKLNEVICSI